MARTRKFGVLQRRRTGARFPWASHAERPRRRRVPDVRRRPPRPMTASASDPLDPSRFDRDRRRSASASPSSCSQAGMPTMMTVVAVPVMTPPAEPGDVRPMSMTQPGAGATARAALDAARDELRGGHRARGGRPRGARAARRPRRRAAAAALSRRRRAGASGGRHRARRLRPAPPLPALRHRPAGAVRRPHRRGRRSGSFAASSIRSGTSASSSATRCASSTSSPSSRPTTPSSCSRCSTRVSVAGAARCSIGSAAMFHRPATHALHRCGRCCS